MPSLNTTWTSSFPKAKKYSLFLLLTLAISTTFAGQAYAGWDLLISQLDEVDVEPFPRDSEVSYTIVTENQLEDIATSVVTTFPIPTDTTYVSLNNNGNGSCSFQTTPARVECDYGNLAPNTSRTLTVTIKATLPPGDYIYNSSATVQSLDDNGSSYTDANTGNNTATQNTTITDSADITTTLVPDKITVSGGNNVTYTATVTNNGPNDTANDIQVIFQLSAFSTYVNGSASGSGWACSYASGPHQITCTRSGGLNLSTDAPDISFTTQVTSDTGSLITTATIPIHDDDPNPNNNVTTSSVSVTPGTDLSIAITASPTSVIEENPTTITLYPRNNGSSNANATTVAYTLPAGFSFSTTTPPVTSQNGWTCDFTTSPTEAICTRANYNVGATNNITFVVDTPAYSGTSSFNNVVTIATSDLSVPEASDYLGNNTASAAVTLTQNGVNLSLTKTKSPNPVAKGSKITSTLVVTNAGPLNALAGTITVTDVIDGINEVYDSGNGDSATGTNWTCTPVVATPITDIQCVYNTNLNSGGTSSTLTIVTTAAAPGLTTGEMSLTNNADVSYSGSPGDYDNTDNNASATITVTEQIADLVVLKSADRATLLAADDTITYTIDICNNGPNAASGITLVDTITSGYYNSATNAGTTGFSVTASPAGYNCALTSTGIRCTPEVGQSLAVSASGCVTPDPGDVHSFTVTFTRPLNTPTANNRASAYSSEVGDNNRSNNETTLSVNVEAQIDLEVRTKTVTPTTVKSGVNATWVVTAYNKGPSLAENVQITDTFTLQSGDPGFTVISVTPSLGTCSGLLAGNSYSGTVPDLVCDLGNMGRHSSEFITIITRPNFHSTPPSPREMYNSASITTDTFESILGNNAKGPITLTIVEDVVDLLINDNDTDNSLDPDPLGPDPLGHNPDSAATNSDNDIVYKLDFKNNGPSYATEVEFDFAMSPDDGKTLQYLCDRSTPETARTCAGPETDTCSLTSGTNPVTGSSGYGTTLTYTCAHGNLATGASAARYLTFRVISEPEPTGDTHNTLATVRANEQENPLLTDNNSEEETTTVRGKVDLEISSKFSTPSSIDRTEAFDWTINLINNGPSSSRGTVLTDDLKLYNMELYDENISCTNATPAGSGGNCSCSVDVDNLLTCDLGTIEKLDTVVVVVPVKVDDWHGSPMQNCVTVVTDDVDSDKTNNEDCGNVTVTNQYHPSDYGDAPDTTNSTGIGNYNTQLNYGGARHYLDIDAVDGKTPYLGACVDADGPGELENIGATADDASGALNPPLNSVIGTCVNNDDEDGVTIPVLVNDSVVNIDVTVSGASCNLSGWVDFNQNGVWTDSGEQIITDQFIDIGTDPSKTESIAITVPDGITVGDSYARFRCATETGLTPTGSSVASHPRYAADGEVEDYIVSLQPENATSLVDYGDAPDPSFPTLLATDAASHVLGQSGAPILGNCVDSDTDGNQSANANADDLSVGGTTIGSCAVAGDDEDGLTFPSLIAGEDAILSINITGGNCYLNGWIDYNKNGSWSDTGEQVFTNQLYNVGTQTPTISIADDVSLGLTQSRFRCTSTSSALGFRGAAPDGEVEDYAIELLGYISGQVRDDVNADGVMSDPDGPLSGVTIQLKDNTGATILTAVTDASGNYLFNGLHAGNYTVVEVDPIGFKSTNDSDGGDPATEEINSISVDLTGYRSVDNDFIDTHLSSIGDFIWFDTNQNGIQDFGENGTAGITVNLYKDPDTTTPLASTTTDGDGYYNFPSLITGTYLVEVEAPAVYTITAQNQGTKDDLDSDIDATETNINTTIGRTAPVILPPGRRNDTLDAGVYLTSGANPARISNLVWFDNNMDGIQDAGEPGISGVSVQLLDSIGTPLATAVTDGSGLYEFTGLSAGDYFVEFSPAPGYIASPARAGTDRATDSDADPTTGMTNLITLLAGENNPTIDAGFFIVGQAPASIGDFVWFDTNKDGIQDNTELGVGGISVSLSTTAAPDTILSSTTTIGSGGYMFSGLALGEYLVTFDLPEGYSFSPLGAGTTATDSDADPTTSQSGPISLTTSGQHDPTIDAGIYITDDNYVSIGDQVWLDDNYNNSFDTGEGIESVTLILYNQFGQEIGRTLTNNTGYYLFSGLPPGDYYVVLDKTTLPAGVYQIADPDPTKDSAHQATNVTTDLNTVDFGYSYNNRIGDYVWFDSNRDGIQDPAESGIAGVTVRLLDSSETEVATTTTDGNGFYEFANLATNQYIVEVVPPTNYVFTAIDQGTDAAKDSFDSDVNTTTGQTALITVGHNTEDFTFDAGLYIDGGTTNPVSLGDYIWFDETRNNIQDPAEEGVGGVVVNLYNAASTVYTTLVATTTSDASGYYSFSGLPAGEYGVEFELPTNYSFVTPLRGTDDSKDSDANTGDGRTSTVVLVAGDNYTDLDAGLYLSSNELPASLGNRVWFDTNKNGVQDAGEAGQPGISVLLYSASDLTTPINSTSTDVNGNYRFTGLATGDYVVKFNISTGHSITITGGGTPSSDSDADPATGFTEAIHLEPGADNPDLDAGIFTAASALYTIGDLVWLDSNHSGTFNAGEGLPGITLVLYSPSGVPLLSTTTNGSGIYSFTEIPAGNYRVAINTSTLPADLVQLADPDSVFDHSHELNGFNASTDLVDFGYREHEVDVELEKDFAFTTDVDNNEKINTGDLLTFTITVVNKGPEAANAVEVTDQLPTGYTLNSVTASQGTYAAPLWTIGTLAVDDPQILTMVATVNRLIPYLNTAEVTGTFEYDIDSTPNNNVETEDDQASVLPRVQNFPWPAFIASIPPCPPNPEFCYMVSDRDSTKQHNSALLKYNFQLQKVEFIGRLGVGEVEAITLSLDGKTLYAANNGVFGIIDTTIGLQKSFRAINPKGFSDGNGSLGRLAFRDIDGLAFSPSTGILYGTSRRGDDLTGLDMLIQIDPRTGDLVKNGFGNGIDYVIINTRNLGVFHTDDIAIDSNGTIYGVVENSGGGGGDLLVTINPDTGEVSEQKELRTEDGTIHDMEGLTSYFRSNLFGTTGVEFSEEGHANSLFGINSQTGQSTLIDNLDGTINGFNPYDFEAVSCPICK